MSRFHGNYADVGKAADYVLDASGGDSIVIPDAHLLFTGAFKRVGSDLLIDGDGRRALLPDYFSHEHGATLLSPNGARLGPDTVRALAGEDSPWQVAQAGGAGGPPEVGTVRTLAGAATVQRGGASHQLSTGAPIYLGDVVETDASSTLGIILRDNTVFSLSASARMVMNELVYDPARSDNAMAISLVQGTFVFITGQVAKTGSVAITTPVATMGIRGTTPIVRLSTVDGSGEFGIAPDPTPGNPVGNYTLTLPSGMQTNVASPDVIIRVTSAASFDAITKTFAEQQSDQQIVAPAYQVYSLIGQRGDIPSPNQQANATGKGQGSGGFQYAFAVMNFAELSATQLLDNTVIAQPETPSDLTTYEDVLRSVIVGSALGVDLDTTADGVNRQARFLENAEELPVTSATQITLPPNVTQLSGAAVVLLNQLPGDNLLVGALPPGITATITFGSIHVTLSGVASAADYIAAIQAIRFVNTSDDPSSEVRVIEVTVTAVNGETATATTFVTIEPVNDAPVNHLPGEQTAAEDANHVFSSASHNAITVSDVDAGTQSLTTTLSVQHGTLTIAAAAGVTVGGNHTGLLVLSGSQSAITAALDGLVYAADANYHGADTLVVSTNDNGATGNGGPLTTTSIGLAINVASVNDAPAGQDKTISLNEDATYTFTSADFGFSDPHDTPVDSLKSVVITTLPAASAGILKVGGIEVTLGQELTEAQLASLTFTPAANANGTDLASFTFQVRDNGGTDNGGVDLDPSANKISFNVSAVNDAPVADNDAYNTTEDHALMVPAKGVLGNDTDVEGNALTATLVTGPAHGSLTLNANGSFTYTPAHDYNGSDSFTYRANDGSADSNTATVNLTIASVNDAPVADNDAYNTTEDHALTVPAKGVLGNDTDVEGNALTATLVTGPAHGSLALNANGSFTYTPAHDYNGSDSFTYRANDGSADSNTATVNLTIASVNDAPVADNDAYNTTEDHALMVPAKGVLGNDTDVEGNALTATLVTGPAHGSLALNANGSFTYTPAHDYNGSDSFTYRANDGSADSNTATVNLTIASVNDAPVADNDAYNTTEDHALMVPAKGVLGNDTDVEGNALTATLVTGPAHGSLALNANGSFTYTPAHDYNGSDSFTYRANDGSADSNTATVNLTIASVNDAPVADNDAYNTTEDHALMVPAKGVLGNDTDVEGNALTATLVTGPAHGSLTLNANGSFTYTPAHDYNGSDSFTYRANDGSADSNTATVNLTIASVNDAPVADNDAYNTTEDHALTVPAKGVLGNDTDVEGNALTATLVTGPAHGSLALNANGSFTYTPAHDYNGSDSFTYRANDGSADSNTATVNLTIASVNDAPINFVPSGTQYADEHHGSLTFSTDNGNAISIFDVDAGNANVRVTLAVQDGILKVDPHPPAGVTIAHNGTSFVTLTGSQLNINAALDGLRYQSNDHDEDEHHHHDDEHTDVLTITTSDLGNSGAGGALIDRDTIRIELESDDHSFSFRSTNSLLSFGAPSDTYTGVGSAVDVIDFSTAAFTTFAFGAETPIDPTYAIDILSHFDGGSHQIDLSGIFDKSAGAGVVQAGNIDDYVHIVDQGGGKVNLLVDPDGAGGSSGAIKIAEISGTAGPDHHPHALGSSTSDVIAVVFDQAQPAANVAVAHAG